MTHRTKNNRDLFKHLSGVYPTAKVSGFYEKAVAQSISDLTPYNFSFDVKFSDFCRSFGLKKSSYDTVYGKATLDYYMRGNVAFLTIANACDEKTYKLTEEELSVFNKFFKHTFGITINQYWNDWKKYINKSGDVLLNKR